METDRKIDVTAMQFQLVQNRQQTHDWNLIGSGTNGLGILECVWCIRNYNWQLTEYPNKKVEKCVCLRKYEVFIIFSIVVSQETELKIA